MAFVDSLRGPDNSKLEGDRYWLDEAAERTQGWIRYFCEQKRSRRMAEGYLLETDLRESGWTLGCFDALYHAPVPGDRYLVGKRVSAMNGAPMFPLQDGAVCLPMTHSPAQAMNAEAALAYFMEELRKLLREDGFTGIRLEKVPCHEVYDVYKQKGGFFSKAETVYTRVETKKLLGYALKFHVEW